MKRILTILLICIASLSFAQTTLPAGSKVIGNTHYQAPDGKIYLYKGLAYAPNAYFLITSKATIDSLTALYLPLAGGTMIGNIGFGVTPTAKIHIKNTGGTNSGILTELTNPASYATTDWLNDVGGIAQLLMSGSTFSNGIFEASTAYFHSNTTGGAGLVASDTNGNISFGAGGFAASNLRARIFGSTGNFVIGHTLDQGYKLAVNGNSHVTGNGFFSGNGNFGGSTANAQLLVSAINNSSPRVALGNSLGIKHWSLAETLGASGEQGNLLIVNEVLGNYPLIINKTTNDANFLSDINVGEDKFIRATAPYAISEQDPQNFIVYDATLGVKSFNSYAGAGTTGGVSSTFASNANYFTNYYAERIRFRDRNNSFASLSIEAPPAITGGNKIITWPNASGTVALTSNLDGYLPLPAGSAYPLSGDLYVSSTAKSWASPFRAIQIGTGFGFIAGRTDGISQLQIGANAYYNGTDWKYSATEVATRYYQNAGQHIFDRAISGIAGNTVSWVNNYTIDASGNNTWTGGGSFGGALTGTTATWSAPIKFTGSTVGAGSERWLGTDGGSGLFFNSPTGSNIIIGHNNVPRYTIDASGNNVWEGGGKFKNVITTGTGSGTEIQNSGGNGYVQSYNRTSSLFEPIYFRGSTIYFESGTSGGIKYTIDASGNNTWTGSGTFGGALTINGYIYGPSSKKFALTEVANINYLYSGGSGGLKVNNQADNTTIFEISDAGHTMVLGNITAANLVSGTYTPTLTNGANTTSSSITGVRYSRAGDEVRVTFYLTITPTAAGACFVNVSLPFASNFTNNYDATGGRTYSNYAADTASDTLIAGDQGVTGGVPVSSLQIFTYIIK